MARISEIPTDYVAKAVVERIATDVTRELKARVMAIVEPEIDALIASVVAELNAHVMRDPSRFGRLDGLVVNLVSKRDAA